MRSLVFLLFFSLAITFGGWVAVDAQAQFGFARADSSEFADMKKSRQALAKNFKFKLKKDRLSVEFPDSESAQTLSDKLLGGSNRSSSSSGDGDSYYTAGSSSNALVSITKDWTNWSSQENRGRVLRLQSITGFRNEITIQDNEDGLVVISADAKQRELNYLKQTDNEFTVVSIGGDKLLHFSGKSIAEFLGQEDFLAVMSALRNSGVGLPAVAPQSSVDDLVEKVLAFSDADKKKFDEQFSGLGSRVYKERKTATALLTKTLKDNVVPVTALLASKTTSTELRSRIRQALKKSKDESVVLLIRTVGNEVASRSAPTLVRLLKKQVEAKADADTIAKTVEQLELATQQSLGQDVAAWEKWLAENADDRQTNEKADNQAAAKEKKKQERAKKRRKRRKTALASVREPLKDLLRLKTSDDGHIVVDKDHWSATFSGDSPQQLIKDVKAYYKETGLPNSWLQIGGGRSTRNIGYEQLLFERVSEKVKNDNHYDPFGHYYDHQSGRTSVLNRSMRKSGLEMSLMVHAASGRGRRRGKRKFFNFHFHDTNENLLYMLSSQEDGSFTLAVIYAGANEMLNFGCDKSGKSWLAHVKDGKAIRWEADSVKALCQEHAAYLASDIRPLLERIGITTADDLATEQIVDVSESDAAQAR